jgi:uncharacterized membrane protein
VTLCEDRAVPLSEDEQRILSQIEQQLYESDPHLAREVGSTTVYTHASRTLKWSVAGFVVGLVIMVLCITVSFWLSFAGFLVMLGSSLVAERSARRIGRAGMAQLSTNMRGGTMPNPFQRRDD